MTKRNQIESKVLDLMYDEAPVLNDYNILDDYHMECTADELIEEIEERVYDADITWSTDESALDFIKKNDPSLDYTMNFIRKCNRGGYNMCRIEDVSTYLLANYCWQMLAMKELESIKESIKNIYND